MTPLIFENPLSCSLLFFKQNPFGHQTFPKNLRTFNLLEIGSFLILLQIGWHGITFFERCLCNQMMQFLSQDMTYYANIIEPLPYLLIKVFNFIKNFLLYFGFSSLIFFFKFEFSLYFLFLYFICTYGLSRYFLLLVEYLPLFLIEFLIVLLACKVQLTLTELNLKVESH